MKRGLKRDEEVATAAVRRVTRNIRLDEKRFETIITSNSNSTNSNS